MPRNSKGSGKTKRLSLVLNTTNLQHDLSVEMVDNKSSNPRDTVDQLPDDFSNQTTSISPVLSPCGELAKKQRLEDDYNVAIFNRYSQLMVNIDAIDSLPSSSPVIGSSRRNININSCDVEARVPKVAAPTVDAPTPGPSHQPLPTPQSQQNAPSLQQTAARPPPIYIDKFGGSLKTANQVLTENHGNTYKLKYLGNKLRVNFMSMEAYKSFKEALLIHDKPFHTYSINSEKTLSMVLKGLPNMPPEDIVAELVDNSLNPLSCIPLAPKFNKSLYCSYKVMFPASVKLQQVMKCGVLFHTRIYWEKFFSQKNYTQCYRCQAFGHSSANCNRKYACLKCAAAHATKLCEKTRDITPTCANCKGPHTANFSSCPALLKYLSARNKTQNQTNDVARRSKNLKASSPSESNGNHSIVNRRGGTVNPRVHFEGEIPTPPNNARFPSLPLVNNERNRHPRRDVTATTRGSLSYVDIVSNKSQTHAYDLNNNLSGQPTLDDVLNVGREINKTCDINLMFQMATTLLNKLKSCNSNLERLQAFLNVAQMYD